MIYVVSWSNAGTRKRQRRKFKTRRWAERKAAALRRVAGPYITDIRIDARGALADRR